MGGSSYAINNVTQTSNNAMVTTQSCFQRVNRKHVLALTQIIIVGH